MYALIVKPRRAIMTVSPSVSLCHIAFWPDLWKAAVKVASERGQSVAELVRAALLKDPDVARQMEQDRASEDAA